MPINEINTNSYTPSKSGATSKSLLDSIASPQFIAPSSGLSAYDKGNFRSIDADAFIWQGFEELALYYATSPERIIDSQNVWETASADSSASSYSSSQVEGNAPAPITIEDGQALSESTSVSGMTHTKEQANAEFVPNTIAITNQKGIHIIENAYFLTPQGNEAFMSEVLPIAGVSSWGWLA